ncbi:MAG: tyrosine recombinase [Clostridia bacterium]|nr:tyrosine recombinase [Clostridia bacterium]
MEEYLTAFMTFLSREKGASRGTLEAYHRDLDAYLHFLAREQIDDLLGVNRETVEHYLAQLLEQGRAGTTVARNLSSIRSLYQYLEEKGDISQNPAGEIHIDRGEKKPLKILTNQEVELLLDQPKAVDSKGCRDKAMLELMYATGIRVSELIALNLSDLDLPRRRLRCGDREHSRMVPMYETAAQCLEEYLKKARPYLVHAPDEQALFVNCKGGRFSRQGFWKLVKHYQQTAGLTKGITPQTLRHSFAIHLMENGADLRSIQQLLGHTNPSATYIYAKLAKERVQDVYHRTHPRA